MEAAIADPSFCAWPQVKEALTEFYQSAQMQDHFSRELAYALYQLLKTGEAQRDHHQSVADIIVEVFGASRRLDYDVADGTLCRSQMMEALTLLEIQARRFGVLPANPLH
ncbi:hypothetical protein [Thalassorhabdomicrobium marinisediminis]|uniref:Uncharacterized protein n=1 Tax=Thalassorhabdomicrobium marinisediminis TaxID=2170577 RepID=A0A2T7FWH1_9RHOB|nr:hypothetical protein [Thalassorhabdomicrobium marinisediminis]PVA06516.1 hypothetical protein DC363_08215 [Thalassorhabdomicrobium marinisediminis]